MISNNGFEIAIDPKWIFKKNLYVDNPERKCNQLELLS